MIRLITFLIICLIMTAIPTVAQIKSGDNAPSITLKDVNGKTISLSQYKGKTVLLNFWATWCPPCRAEIPELIKWQQEYQDQGLQIIGITYPPTNRKKVRAFLNKNKINYPILFGSRRTKELFDQGETMPLTIVIDKTGMVKDQIEGIVYADEFEEKIKPLLKTDQKKPK